MVRINGKLRTVQRAAWEFAHGALPAGVRVNSGAGSVPELHRGAWQLAITDGSTPDGRSQRR